MTKDSPQSERKPLRIGKYEVLAHIASGGMGAVYKAIDVDLNRLVALKILSPELAAKPNMVQRFRREARAAAQLRHENIVAIHDFGNHHGTIYLALEYVEGKDLHEYITRKGKLEVDEAKLITIQSARALDHAHRQGVVHRDVKPANLLISSRAGKLVVKLIDLGLARHQGDQEFRVTKPGVTIGTVDYMAPEQARDSRSADIRSDLYALGCTLYHMLTGHAPFYTGSLPERIYQHIETVPPDIRKLNPKVPDALAAIIAKLLAKKPEDRFQTPLDLLKALDTPESFRAYLDQAEHEKSPPIFNEEELEVKFRPPSTMEDKKVQPETLEMPAPKRKAAMAKKTLHDVTVEFEAESAPDVRRWRWPSAVWIAVILLLILLGLVFLTAL